MASTLSVNVTPSDSGRFVVRIWQEYVGHRVQLCAFTAELSELDELVDSIVQQLPAPVVPA